MRTSTRATFLTLLCLMAAACQQSQKERAFRDLFGDVTMNEAMHFWEPSSAFTVGGPISVALENDSPNEIGISAEDGILAFVFQDGRWIGLKNNAGYVPSESVLVPNGPDQPGVTGISLVPDLQDVGDAVKVRVVVLGSVYVNGQKTGQQEGAFIDVLVMP